MLAASRRSSSISNTLIHSSIRGAAKRTLNASLLPPRNGGGSIATRSADQDKKVDGEREHDDRGQDHVALPVQAEQMPDPSAEDGAERHEESRPHGGRDGDARDKDSIADAEDPRRHRERHAKSRDVSPEDERPDSIAREPSLGLIDARRCEVQEFREPVLDDRSSPA